MRDAAQGSRVLGQRLYVRFYLALLASLLAAAVLFGLAHLRFDPSRTRVAIIGAHAHAMGFIVLPVLIALLVAAAAYPVVRRLTGRLERLQRSVEAWGEGQLAMRVAVEGKDEVARLAASFNDSAARIEALVAAQKSLLANASHELRSPLARIRMAAELMAGQATPSIRAELQRNVAELDQLIDEILLASRLDAVGTAIPCPEEVDLTGILAEECARVGASLDAGMSGMRGDAKLLRRMVRNLLENAVRYGAGSPIDVRLAEAGEAALHLDVRDGGPGIPDAERERIFAPFYRIAGASEAAGGVGLGLSLVRQIARHHGGDVQCMSSEAGCCLRVTLPRAR
jgi:two-component system OmpR family sensor kinase